MPETIHVNGTAHSLIHKSSNGIASSTIPDVCKTPSPAGPVPIPYPVIVSMSSDLDKGSKTVKADGGNMVAIKDCEFSRCTGDEAGTAGGVVSSTFGKEAKFILYSFDVKIDGANACRLGDKMTMNHQNTMCLVGPINPPVTVPEFTDALCQDMCDHENGAQASPPKHRRSSSDLEKSCRDCKNYGPNLEFKTIHSTPSFTRKTTRPDAFLKNPKQCFDFKLCGDRPRNGPAEQQTLRQASISGGNDPIIIDCKNCQQCKPTCTCP